MRSVIDVCSGKGGVRGCASKQASKRAKQTDMCERSARCKNPQSRLLGLLFC